MLGWKIPVCGNACFFQTLDQWDITLSTSQTCICENPWNYWLMGREALSSHKEVRNWNTEEHVPQVGTWAPPAFVCSMNPPYRLTGDANQSSSSDICWYWSRYTEIVKQISIHAPSLFSFLYSLICLGLKEHHFVHKLHFKWEWGIATSIFPLVFFFELQKGKFPSDSSF